MQTKVTQKELAKLVDEALYDAWHSVATDADGKRVDGDEAFQIRLETAARAVVDVICEGEYGYAEALVRVWSAIAFTFAKNENAHIQQVVEIEEGETNITAESSPYAIVRHALATAIDVANEVASDQLTDLDAIGVWDFCKRVRGAAKTGDFAELRKELADSDAAEIAACGAAAGCTATVGHWPSEGACRMAMAVQRNPNELRAMLNEAEKLLGPPHVRDCVAPYAHPGGVESCALEKEMGTPVPVVEVVLAVEFANPEPGEPMFPAQWPTVACGICSAIVLKDGSCRCPGADYGPTSSHPAQGDHPAPVGGLIVGCFKDPVLVNDGPPRGTVAAESLVPGPFGGYVPERCSCTCGWRGTRSELRHNVWCPVCGDSMYTTGPCVPSAPTEDLKKESDSGSPSSAATVLDHPAPVEGPRTVPWEMLGQIEPKELPMPSWAYPGPWTEHGRGNGHFDIRDASERIFAHVYCYSAEENTELARRLADARAWADAPQLAAQDELDSHSVAGRRRVAKRRIMDQLDAMPPAEFLATMERVGLAEDGTPAELRAGDDGAGNLEPLSAKELASLTREIRTKFGDSLDYTYSLVAGNDVLRRLLVDFATKTRLIENLNAEVAMVRGRLAQAEAQLGEVRAAVGAKDNEPTHQAAWRAMRHEWFDRNPTPEEVQAHAEAYPVTAIRGGDTPMLSAWLYVCTDARGIHWPSLEILRAVAGRVVDDDGGPTPTWKGRWLRLTAEGVPAR